MLSELTCRVVSLFRRLSKLVIVDAHNETAEPSWKRRLFKKLIELAKFQVSDIDQDQVDRLGKNTVGELLGCRIVITRGPSPSPGEVDSVRADIVEALALAGDLTAAEKFSKTIEDFDDSVSALQDIILGWARKDLDRAIKMSMNPIPKDPELVGTEFDDEDYQETGKQRKNALRGILGVVAEEKEPSFVVKWITEVLPKYLKHDTDEDAPCLICRSQDILAGAMAAAGDIEGAREVAKKQRIPADKVDTWLAVYKTSRAPEDLEAARAIAEGYDYEPHEQWLKIAEATHESRDVAKVKTEVAAMPSEDDSKGWSANFTRNRVLVVIAKITGDPNDIAASREVITANPTAYSVIMEFCRVTRDPQDFALLVNSARSGDDRYSALACIAEITGEEKDFVAAAQEAMNIVSPIREASSGYLRGRSLAELAQVLCGKSLHR